MSEIGQLLPCHLRLPVAWWAATMFCLTYVLPAAWAAPTPYRFYDSLEIASDGATLPPFGFALDKDGNWFMSSAGGVNAISRYTPGDAGPEVLVSPGAGSAQLNNPASIAVGPDGLLYLANVAGHSVTRFNATTGAFVDNFVPAGSGGLAAPLGLTFGPDGHLYVASRDTDAVLRYDGATGRFLGSFVTSGSGGLKAPLTPTFGPDGNLYVTSRDTNSVLRYNGVTGAFLGEFIAPGSGGLLAPNSLAFGPDQHAYVTSRESHAVLRYDGATGSFLDAVVPAGAHGMTAPRAIEFDDDGLLYVASTGSNEVMRFAPLPYPGELQNPGVRMWDLEATVFAIQPEGPFFDTLRQGDTIRVRLAYDLNARRSEESTPNQAYFHHALEFGVLSASFENPRTGESLEFLPAKEETPYSRIVGIGTSTLEPKEPSDTTMLVAQSTTTPMGYPTERASVTFHMSRPEELADLNLPAELDLDDWPIAQLTISEQFLGPGILAQIESLTPVAVPPVTADADGDHDIDGADSLAWQRGLGITASASDFDRNAQVDEVDLAFWQQ